MIREMQLANNEVVWYFIFGSKQKSSLAAQYALEHSLLHLVAPSETTLKEHDKKGLMVEGSAELFRKVESWKLELTVIFLQGELSAEEKAIKKDYENIGRCVGLQDSSYLALRKELYPRVIVVYGPNKQQNKALADGYFQFTGYHLVYEPVTANHFLAHYPKHRNYVLLAFTPLPQEVAILEAHCHLKIVHLRHLRTELTGHEEFFDQEAQLVPQLQKRPTFSSVEGHCPLEELLLKVGEKVSPELVYVNVHDGEEREGVRRFIEQSEALLLSIFEIQSVWRRKPTKLKADAEKLELLVQTVFRNFTRREVYFTDFPWKPEEFMLLEKRTRPFKLFADCLKPEKYELSRQFNSTIYFLETQRRRHIQLDFPFEKQISSPTKYLVLAGPPCVGKTSAAKFISAELGYRHIEYEPYVAALKEKLIAPEDGEELPFRKVTAHFASLIANSGSAPLLIDGLNVDWKDIDSWVKANGPPVVINLKTDDKELTRRTRKKAEADLAAEVTEEEAAKIKEAIAKNADWADQLGARCPLAVLYQVDFSQPLIQAERLLEEILKPRVFLVQDNVSLLYQNVAIRQNLGYFNLRRHSLREVADLVRKGQYRDVLLCNYAQNSDQLICEDFYWIEKHIGPIRYLSIWTPEAIDAHDELLHLVPPPQPEKPKPAEGEEGGEPAPPAEEEGEKKKALNIYDFSWTKPGNQKNISQWFFKLKKNVSKTESKPNDCFLHFGKVLQTLSEQKELAIYDLITA